MDDQHLVRWLLDRGIDLNKRCDWDLTPVSAAVKNGTLSTFKLLLKRGADLRCGQLLHWAILRTKADAVVFVDWLLRLGLPINAIRYKEDRAAWIELWPVGMGTPLHHAVENNREEMVNYLLWRGVDREVKDSLGRTARNFAMTAGNRRLVQLLDE